MTHFRVVVVDDEPLARDMTVALLERDPEVTVVGRCGDADEARAVMRRERPQIVFLDIEMPGTDGLELVRGLSPAHPAFVFVTAFSEYATEAFDVQALDYVLKPFSDERLYEALARAKRRGPGASTQRDRRGERDRSDRDCVEGRGRQRIISSAVAR